MSSDDSEDRVTWSQVLRQADRAMGGLLILTAYHGWGWYPEALLPVVAWVGIVIGVVGFLAGLALMLVRTIEDRSLRTTR